MYALHYKNIYVRLEDGSKYSGKLKFVERSHFTSHSKVFSMTSLSNNFPSFFLPNLNTDNTNSLPHT